MAQGGAKEDTMEQPSNVGKFDFVGPRKRVDIATGIRLEILFITIPLPKTFAVPVLRFARPDVLTSEGCRRHAHSVRGEVVIHIFRSTRATSA